MKALTVLFLSLICTNLFAQSAASKHNEAVTWLESILGEYRMQGGLECESFKIVKRTFIASPASYEVHYKQSNTDLPSSLYFDGFPGTQTEFSINKNELVIKGNTRGAGGFISGSGVVFEKGVRLTKDDSGQLVRMDLFSKRNVFSTKKVQCYVK